MSEGDFPAEEGRDRQTEHLGLDSQKQRLGQRRLTAVSREKWTWCSLYGQREAQKASLTLNKPLLAAPPRKETPAPELLTTLIKGYGGQGKHGTNLLGLSFQPSLSHFFF